MKHKAMDLGNFSFLESSQAYGVWDGGETGMTEEKEEKKFDYIADLKKTRADWVEEIERCDWEMIRAAKDIEEAKEHIKRIDEMIAEEESKKEEE